MNIVLAMHKGNPSEYCFEVPDQMAESIKKGMFLFVDTARGPSVAHATSNVMTGEAAEIIAKKNGARFPLCQVKSFLAPEFQSAIEFEIMKRVEKSLRQAVKQMVKEAEPVFPAPTHYGEDVPF